MCGIAGFIDFNCQLKEQDLINMTDVLEHRGPDAKGYHFDVIDNKLNIGLGHRRLSILDLSPLGKQPYYYEDLVLVFNGEIYNFDEIKQDLEKEGMSFQSTSDTEMIIKAYARYGLDCLDRFIGMFSIIIFDKKANVVHCIRDRAGVKPLYYYHKNGLFLFSSELKSFHEIPQFEKQVDQRSIASYFKYSYIPSPFSIYLDTYKVRPGHILTINLDSGESNEKQYWSVIEAYNKPKTTMDFQEASEELEKLLISACNYRMVADVPVGVFLSGGFDSSGVSAILAKHHNNQIKTFTIGFEDERFNEAPHAKKISEYLGTEHTEHYCTHKEALSIIPRLPEIYDEPLGDNSVIPTTLVSQMARKSVTVALSSDAGDEIFAGYPRYIQALKYTNMLPDSFQKTAGAVMDKVNPNKLPFLNRKKNFGTRFEKMSEIWQSGDPVAAMDTIMQFNTEKALRKMMPDIRSHQDTWFQADHYLNDSNDAVNKMLAVDYLTFLLDNNLPKVDRATMSVALEGREPLLDHRLTEFAATLPSSYKLKGSEGKHIYKSIVYKYIPKELMERPKQGFLVPIHNWFREELKDYISQYLNPERLKKQGIFDPKVIAPMVKSYLDDRGENVQKIWHLLVFQLWYYRWVEKS